MESEHRGPPHFTACEVEVLVLIAKGKTSEEIAHMLAISTETVDNHRRRIMEKLNVYSNEELVRYAIRVGCAKL